MSRDSTPTQQLATTEVRTLARERVGLEPARVKQLSLLRSRLESRSEQGRVPGLEKLKPQVLMVANCLTSAPVQPRAALALASTRRSFLRHFEPVEDQHSGKPMRRALALPQLWLMWSRTPRTPRRILGLARVEQRCLQHS